MMDGGYTWEDYFMAAFRQLLPRWGEKGSSGKCVVLPNVIIDCVNAADAAVEAVNERKAERGQSED
jgi:hypothetical protein